MFEGLTAGVSEEIRRRLDSVKREGLRIGFAIESGSRAWGFPSPDSDFDCRFVYIRPVTHHLRLSLHRDVIEFPIVGDIDAGGWDLRKALGLALKGNAVIVEWVKSPLVYEEEPGFRMRLDAVLDDIMQPSLVARHYAGLLREHYPGGEPESVRLKKFLYAIRPAIALQWMGERDFCRLPPMNMLECLEGTSVPEGVKAEILALVERKKLTKELGEGAPHPVLRGFIRDMNDQYARLPPRPAGPDPEQLARANDFYAQEVARLPA